MDFKTKYGPYVIVTGASAGLGESFARELGAQGVNLVLVARRESKIAALGKELTAAHGIVVRTVALDLAREDAAEELARETESLDIGAVIVNAAQILIGPFLDNDLTKEANAFHLNTYALMQIAHRFGNRLRKRGRGGLLLVSSIIGFGAGPFQANYAATKAYVTSFGQALHVELARSGVDVTVVAPGGMNTEGIQNSGYDFSALPMMDPRDVARIGVRALGRRAIVVPGALNAFTALLLKVLPRSVSARLFGSVVARMIAQRAQERPAKLTTRA